MFDQADSYHQWLVNPKHAHKISFMFEGIQYHFVRACFGIKTMTSLFQRVITEMLQGVEDAEAYVNDVGLACADLSQFITRGIEVLKRFNKYHVRLRLKKCTWIASKLVHLGRIVSQAGYAPDPHKIEEILNWERPATIKSLHSFVCLAGYYREQCQILPSSRNRYWMSLIRGSQVESSGTRRLRGRLRPSRDYLMDRGI